MGDGSPWLIRIYKNTDLPRLKLLAALEGKPSFCCQSKVFFAFREFQMSTPPDQFRNKVLLAYHPGFIGLNITLEWCSTNVTLSVPVACHVLDKPVGTDLQARLANVTLYACSLSLWAAKGLNYVTQQSGSHCRYEKRTLEWPRLDFL